MFLVTVVASSWGQFYKFIKKGVRHDLSGLLCWLWGQNDSRRAGTQELNISIEYEGSRETMGWGGNKAGRHDWWRHDTGEIVTNRKSNKIRHRREERFKQKKRELQQSLKQSTTKVEKYLSQNSRHRNSTVEKLKGTVTGLIVSSLFWQSGFIFELPGVAPCTHIKS